MSFRKIGQGVLLGLSGFCAFSCSVREDRSNCPCHLVLDVRDVPAVMPPGGFSLRWNVSQGTFSDSGWLSEEDCAGLFHVVVPRGGVQVYAVTGDEGLFDRGLEIAPGHGCPPVRFWCAALNTDGETAEAAVRLRKAYCRLTIRLAGEPGPRDYRLLVEGNICGYDSAGYPLAGPFRCEPEPAGAEGKHRSLEVCLPRQTDDSLLLHVYDTWADDAPPLRTFALGHAMAASGYDWTAPDLEDLTLEMDFAASTLILSTDRWTSSHSFEVLI